MGKLSCNTCGRIILLGLLTIVIRITPAFSQQSVDQTKIAAFQNAKSILREFKTKLLAVPGVQQIKISRDGATFALSVFASEETDQAKIPKDLKGLSVRVITQKPFISGSASKAFQKTRAIRDKYRGQLLQLGVKDIQIVGAPGVQFALLVTVDSAANQQKIPKTLEDVPVRVVVRQDEAGLTDQERRLKVIQDRHADELFEYDGVAVFMIREEGGEYFFEVGVKSEDDLVYIPKEIEGVKVISRVTGEIKGADTCNPPPSPCDHRLTCPFPVPMGVSTSNYRSCGSGTLGFTACSGPDFGYVACNHQAAGVAGCPNQDPTALHTNRVLRTAVVYCRITSAWLTIAITS